MFTTFSSYEVSLLILALEAGARNDMIESGTRRDMTELRERLITQRAKHELSITPPVPAENKLRLSNTMREVAIDRGLPMRDVELAPVDLKECEGRILPDVEPPAPPTEPNLGAEYHLLKFIDAMREKYPDAGALSGSSTAYIIDTLGEAIAGSKCHGKPQAVCQIFAREMARIVNHLEEG